MAFTSKQSSPSHVLSLTLVIWYARMTREAACLQTNTGALYMKSDAYA